MSQQTLKVDYVNFLRNFCTDCAKLDFQRLEHLDALDFERGKPILCLGHIPEAVQQTDGLFSRCWLCSQRSRSFAGSGPRCSIHVMDARDFTIGLPQNEASPCLVIQDEVLGYRPIAWIDIYESKKDYTTHRPLTSTINISFLKELMRTCQKYHISKCFEKAESTMDMKLLDCHTMKVIKRSSSAPYFALNYVWGSGEEACFSQHVDGSLKLESLSRTVQDAISFTHRMGFRYLWVDKLCIDQSNADEMYEQIVQMDKIYAGGELTLVAAAGEDENFGIPGVRSNSRPSPKADIIEFSVVQFAPFFLDSSDEIQRSRWITRGWTFQEAFLSKRILVFLETHAVFECRLSTRVESFWHSSMQQEDQVPYTTERLILPGSYVSATFLVSDVISQYTMRSLRHDSDSFAAFAGMAAYFRRQSEPIFNLCGVPILLFEPHEREGSKFSTLDSALGAGLTWSHDTVQPSNLKSIRAPSPRPAFPSWTWVVWCGQVDMRCFYKPECLSRPAIELRAVELVDTSLISSETLTALDLLSSLDASKISALHLNAMLLLPKCLNIEGHFGDIWIDSVEARFQLSEEVLHEIMIDSVKIGNLRILGLMVVKHVLMVGRHSVESMLVRKVGQSYVRVGIVTLDFDYIMSAQEVYAWFAARSETCPVRLA